MSHSPLHASSPAAASTNSPHGIVTPVQEKQDKDKEVHTSKAAGASWKNNEQQVLPQNRLWIVFPGLMCCVFLAALDQVCSQSCLFSSGAFTHSTDHRRNRFTNHCRTSWRGQKLQLGWKVSLLSFSLPGLFSSFFSVPTSLRPARSPHCTESCQISLAENPFFTLLSCRFW